MKDRILKELGFVLDSEKTVGFFSFTISKMNTDRIVPTVTFVCDEALPEQREKITTALFALFDTIKPVFLKEKHEG